MWGAISRVADGSGNQPLQWDGLHVCGSRHQRERVNGSDGGLSAKGPYTGMGFAYGIHDTMWACVWVDGGWMWESVPTMGWGSCAEFTAPVWANDRNDGGPDVSGRCI